LGGGGGGTFIGYVGGGGGGGAAGGAIFVRSDNGATLTVADSGINGNATAGGSPGFTQTGSHTVQAGAGIATGAGLFLNGGNATFEVDGGTVTISDTISDAAFAGGPAAGIIKTGSGTLVLSGDNNLGGALSPNAGTLEITGTVTNGTVSGIAATGGTAVLKIAGSGANWTSLSDILLGHNGGTGTLEISGGATANDTFALVGRTTGGTGHVTVTGTSSTWTHSAGLVIGTGGAGTMLVSDGAQVSNTDGWIGGNAGSDGTVTVTGEASRWSSTAYLVVGGAGDGALNVVDGGTVKVGPTGGGTLTLANSGSSAGTLNIGAPAGEAALPAGTIQAGTITGGSGGGAKLVNFNHTETDYVFSANMTAGLSVRQISGVTTLGGTNTYTGNTVISNGTLAIAEGGCLTFHIGGSNTNNAVLGTGSLQAGGAFTFNLANASTNTGDVWTIVAPGITANYGTNFLVTGFDGSGGNWTNSTNGVDYVFQQATGKLTVGAPITNNYQVWVGYWQGQVPGFTNVAGTDDPDGDAFDNDQEFAFDGNPTVGTAALLTTVKAGTNAVFTWVQRKNPPGGVTYAVEETASLSEGPWTNSPVTISNSADQSGLEIPDDYERKEFMAPAAGDKFFRVQAVIEP
ncbi:MAG: hypothetical protein IAE97_12750, partial [Chthoniobacterales bacterium]|nr:hypothetical protein [Chthoniobacterales bacterium]